MMPPTFGEMARRAAVKEAHQAARTAWERAEKRRQALVWGLSLCALWLALTWVRMGR